MWPYAKGNFGGNRKASLVHSPPIHAIRTDRNLLIYISVIPFCGIIIIIYRQLFMHTFFWNISCSCISCPQECCVRQLRNGISTKRYLFLTVRPSVIDNGSARYATHAIFSVGFYSYSLWKCCIEYRNKKNSLFIAVVQLGRKWNLFYSTILWACLAAVFFSSAILIVEEKSG